MHGQYLRVSTWTRKLCLLQGTISQQSIKRSDERRLRERRERKAVIRTRLKIISDKIVPYSRPTVQLQTYYLMYWNVW
jgi:hypothetical protein